MFLKVLFAGFVNKCKINFIGFFSKNADFTRKEKMFIHTKEIDYIGFANG